MGYAEDTAEQVAPLSNSHFVVDSDQKDYAGPRPWRARLARQAVPFPVAALLWGATEAAHLNLDVFPLGAPAASAVYLVAAMGYWTAWAKRNPANRAARRLWATTLIGTGTGWVLWASLAGPTPLALGALIAGGGAAMLPYWTRNAAWRPGRRQPEPPVLELPELPEAPEVDTVEVETIPKFANQLHWETVVAGPNGIPNLRDTYLTEPVISDAIEQYTIQCPPGGRVTTGSILSVAANIAGAYGRSMLDAAVLRHPSGTEDKALIRFARANPLAKAKDFPSPQQALDLTGGNIRCLIGHRADGTEVWWEFYRAHFGTMGGAVFGDTGSGKSFLLRILITAAAYSKLIVPIVSCPQGGASFPMWIKHGHWPATSAKAILEQGRSLLKGHLGRGEVNELRGGEVHVPTPDEPLILWFIDEVHKMNELSDAEAAEFFWIVDAISREGRKTGYRVIVGDQHPSVPKTFRNLMTLRNSLVGAAGQCVTLRLSSNIDTMLPESRIKPETIPSKFPDGTITSGLGALVGDTELCRVCNITNSQQLAENAPAIELDRYTANKMGPAYLERHERLIQARAAIAAEINEYDPKLLAEILAANPDLAAALPAATAARQQAKQGAEQAAQTAANQHELHISLPDVPSLHMPEPEPEPTTWTCLERVEQVLKAGVTAFGEIHTQATKPNGERYSETAVRDALKELIAQGLVEDGGYKHYRFRAA